MLKFAELKIIISGIFMSQTRRNLAAARELLIHYLESIRFKSNHSGEIELLMELLNHLTTIMTQSRWSSYTEGSFANYWEKKEIPKRDLPLLTQSQLIAEAEKIVFNTSCFTYKQAQRLYLEVCDGRYKPLLKRHRQLIDEVVGHISAVIKNIDPKWKPPIYNKEKKEAERKAQALLKNKKGTGALSQGFYYLANILNGFYIPLDQSVDPLSGETKGYCFGHVLAWADEISKKGRYTSAQLSVSPQVDYTQLHQAEDKQKIYYLKNYCSPLDLYGITNSLLKKIETNVTFRLSLYSDKGNDGHACGIRKIPTTKEIEFFDPNFGLFVFKAEEDFRAWFSCLIETRYFKTGFNNCISLIKINEQTSDAALSIPYSDVHPLSKQEKEKINGYLAEKAPSETLKKISPLLKKIKVASRIAISSGKRDWWEKANDSIYNTMLSYQQLLKNGLFLVKSKRPEDEKLTDDALKLYKKNVDSYHVFLKKQACEAIDKEMLVLGKDKTYSNQVIALSHLKERINQAGPHITLAAIIDQWLFVSNEESKTLHYDLMKQLPKTYEAIALVRSHYETSPFVLSLLQDLLLRKVLTAIEKHARDVAEPKKIDFFYKKKTIPGTLAKIKQYVFDYSQKGEVSACEVLEKICVECRKKDTDLFANILSWRNTEVACIYKLLKKIKPHNLHSLRSTCSELNAFYRKNNASSPSVSPRP